jgi:hypothetical protein
MRKYTDEVTPGPMGFLQIQTRMGFRAMIAIREIQSVRKRTEGGCSIHTTNGSPILIDVPMKVIIAAMETGADDAKAS